MQKKEKKTLNLKDMIILIDTREQLPYMFKGYPCSVETKCLATGDYSLRGYEKRIVCERKSKADLYGSFGAGRDRFQREFERLRVIKYPFLIIESSLSGLLEAPPFTSMHPHSVVQSVISWGIRYEVYVYFADDRRLAEATIFHIFEKFLYNKKKYNIK